METKIPARRLKLTGMKRIVAGVVCIALVVGVLPAASRAQTGEAPPVAAHAPVVTRHHGIFGGKSIRYSANVESLDVPDAQGKPGARLVSIAYLAESSAAPAARPVMFVFNGGPITASLWLHVGVMGPKRVAVPDDLHANPASFALVDNPYSPLDVADLVFIDPASTGFSRVLPGVSPNSYYSVVADAQQVTAFISQWLTMHHRVESPAYLLGESYGTIRAAEVAAQLAELPRPILVDGVALLGQGLNIIEYSQRPQNIISYVVSLPTLAAIAWYHRKVKRGEKSLDQFVDEAWAYAQADYLGALFQGNALSVGDRDRVASRLEQLSGIPAEYYREHDLRITKERYRRELLKDEGLLLGQSDARYVAQMTKKGEGPDAFADTIMPAYMRAFVNYLRDDLGVNWPQTYVGVAPVKGLDEWGWGATTPFSDWPYTERLLKAMRMNPRCRVLIGNGYYDTQTTVGAAILAAREADWPKDRVTLRFYEGGHMAYTVGSAAEKFTTDLRALVRSSAGPAGSDPKP
jgi:carboxypeptidase C (cathepsin A)